jgi:nicotinamide riboside transporter PnuC
MTLKTFHFAGVASMSILYILITFIFIQEEKIWFKCKKKYPEKPSQKNRQTYGMMVRH